VISHVPSSAGQLHGRENKRATGKTDRKKHGVLLGGEIYQISAKIAAWDDG